LLLLLLAVEMQRRLTSDHLLFDNIVSCAYLFGLQVLANDGFPEVDDSYSADAFWTVRRGAPNRSDPISRRMR
jgi:hypothetical protein